MPRTNQSRTLNLGNVYMTPGVSALVEEGLNLVELLGRHQRGDWGDLCAEDRRENELSIRKGFRVLSSYQTEHGKVWIITEADRSSTTALLPDEY